MDLECGKQSRGPAHQSSFIGTQRFWENRLFGKPLYVSVMETKVILELLWVSVFGLSLPLWLFFTHSILNYFVFKCLAAAACVTQIPPYILHDTFIVCGVCESTGSFVERLRRAGAEMQKVRLRLTPVSTNSCLCQADTPTCSGVCCRAVCSAAVEESPPEKPLRPCAGHRWPLSKHMSHVRVLVSLENLRSKAEQI